MSSAGGRPLWQTTVSVGTSIVPPGPCPPPEDTPGSSSAITTPQATASIHDGWLTTTYSAAPDMRPDVVQLRVNDVSYPVDGPPVNIPLPVGSLVHLGVQAFASLVNPSQSSSLVVSLLPALTMGED